jgi:hypothetical protein
MIMGKSSRHTAEAEVRGHGTDESTTEAPGLGEESTSSVRVRRPRTPKDPATMTPLELKIHKIKQSHKLIELAKGLDANALAELIDELADELGKLQVSAPAV